MVGALIEQSLYARKKPAWARDDSEEVSSKCPAGGFDHFGDGICDSTYAAHAYKSGLATACVVRVGKMLSENTTIQFGQRAIDFWRFKGSKPEDCKGCRYFWASDIQADNNRFVRNTSLFLALPFAMSAGGAGRTPATVIESLKVEAWERSKGNCGYLSTLDPQWKLQISEADRIENHAPSDSVLLRGIAIKSCSQVTFDLVLWNYDSWVNCSNDLWLKTPGCKYGAGNPQLCAVTASYAHCAFRNVSAQAREKCLTILQRDENLNLNPMLWILVGDSAIQKKNP